LKSTETRCVGGDGSNVWAFQQFRLVEEH